MFCVVSRFVTHVIAYVDISTELHQQLHQVLSLGSRRMMQCRLMELGGIHLCTFKSLKK